MQSREVDFRKYGLSGCKSLTIFGISKRPGGPARCDGASVGLFGCNRNPGLQNEFHGCARKYSPT
jgi:hypothetical protein